MPVPIICLDDELCHFIERYRRLLSKPQYQYFVIVLLGLMLCEGRRTLVGLLEQVAEQTSLSGLSRFLAQAPWDTQAVGQQWLHDFRARMQPAVEAEQERQRRTQPKQPLVTGYLIGDDSTMHQPKGKKMEGLGQHHSTTVDGRLPGHSMVEGLYVLLGQRCPLVPQLYRQQAVCEQEGVGFHSKIELMEALLRSFEPVADTRTHVVLDSWYCAKCLWKAARAGLCDHHRHEKQSLAAYRRPERAAWLAVATPLGLRGLPGPECLCRRQVATRRQDGVCACSEDAGAQTVLLPGGDCAPVARCTAFAGALLRLQRSGG
jgi:DDE superfamily endonuclease